jgi:hypothetical protein
MAADNISIQHTRDNRSITIIQGDAKLLNEAVKGSSGVVCLLRPNDKMLCTIDELCDIVFTKINRMPYIKLLYSDNILNLDEAKVRQYLPSVFYDHKIIINTPLILNGNISIALNENLKHLYLWDLLRRTRNYDIVSHIAKPLFEIKSISQKEQEEDLKCLKQDVTYTN